MASPALSAGYLSPADPALAQVISLLLRGPGVPAYCPVVLLALPAARADFLSPVFSLFSRGRAAISFACATVCLSPTI